MGFTNVYGMPSWQRHVERHSARIIDGAAIAAQIRADVAQGVEALVARTGRRPGLATVAFGVGPAAAIWTEARQQACREVGIELFEHRLPAHPADAELDALINRLNTDAGVSAIFCEVAVPGHLDTVLTTRITPEKDIDALEPCAPAGVMALLEDCEVQLDGAEAVVVGSSSRFGSAMSQLLLSANATVTTAHSHTRDLPAVCRRADVLIVAVGSDRMVKADWVRTGAIVVDLGVNAAEDGMHGDVDLEAVQHVASVISPSPGGVEAVTAAVLVRNTLRAAEAAAA